MQRKTRLSQNRLRNKRNLDWYRYAEKNAPPHHQLSEYFRLLEQRSTATIEQEPLTVSRPLWGWPNCGFRFEPLKHPI